MASGPDYENQWLLPTEKGSRLHAAAGVDGIHFKVDAPRHTDERSQLYGGLLERLVEMGLAEPHGQDQWKIAYESFVSLSDIHEIDAFEGLVPFAPWALQVESSGSPGFPDFAYRYHFVGAHGPLFPIRRGCFVALGGIIRRLDRSAFALVEAIDAFMNVPGDERTGGDAFIRFAQIRDLAEEVGAQLDSFLLRERVVVPPDVELDIIPEKDGRISFAPLVAGVPAHALRHAFFAGAAAEGLYSVDDGAGGRIRVVFNAQQREVLRRMQRARHLGGAEKAEALRDPQRYFDGVGDAINLTGYGARVKGIGDFPFVVRPYIHGSSTGIFDDPDRPEHTNAWKPGIRCEYADGSSKDVPFGSRAEAREFCIRADDAANRGSATLEWKGKTIPLNAELRRAAHDLARQVNAAAKSGGAPPSKPGKFLLILQNNGSLEYEEPTPDHEDGEAVQLPKDLQIEQLKPHQLEGLAWMQRALRGGKRGCLLADDMGLGKTLQTLCFLAWYIEQGHIAPGSTDLARPPWNPILIVAPLTLIEAETWQKDARHFFRGMGRVFQPWTVLRQAELKALRTAEGSETEKGGPVLDLHALRRYRVIFTNYETVTRYQHSFAALRDGLSILVCDEAQEAKTPDTKISHALKSLAPRFRIACTGTPVETRLLDLWNIVDLLQPGRLLGTAKEFSKQFEAPLQDGPEAGSAALTQLRNALRVGRPSSWILRREKTQLSDFPLKHEKRLTCELSEPQRSQHLDLVSKVSRAGDGGHPLQVLGYLMRLYQHPALVPRYEPLAPAEALAQAPKLRALVAELEKIRRKGEKALIFTRTLDMQQILQTVLGAHFGIEVGIVNGAVPRAGDTQHSRESRKSILERFQTESGFGAIVLSPDVAGVGLTLTEANHVFHYGRWWNPARESQATDRAYRLGQTRPVWVYYLVARDPRREFETFDEKLDSLLARRRQLANDFLAPSPPEDTLRSELYKAVTAEAPTESPASAAVTDPCGLDWRRFEALIATMEARRGADVLLTPGSGDGKADVISVLGTEMRLIQCKQGPPDAHIDADPLAEILSALDLYRARFLGDAALRFSLKPMVVTSCKFTRGAQRLAQERGIELVDGSELRRLLGVARCSLSEVEIQEARRIRSGRDLPAAIAALVAPSRKAT